MEEAAGAAGTSGSPTATILGSSLNGQTSKRASSFHVDIRRAEVYICAEHADKKKRKPKCPKFGLRSAVLDQRAQKSSKYMYLC
jgi:hypothetical protein